MRTLITGMNGTVAPVLAETLRREDHSIRAWDRNVNPVDTYALVKRYISEVRPDWLFHLATGSVDWAEWLAQICFEEGIRFHYTSSVSVFSGKQEGPFKTEAVPEPEDDYGKYKRDCEQRIMRVNPNAIITRLGWQIGYNRHGNQMLNYLYKRFQQDGKIAASVNWFPACSFLTDTADSLYFITANKEAGLYQLDANPGLNFFEIVSGLNRIYGHPWRVEASDGHKQNNLMKDPRVTIRPLNSYFQ